MTEEIGFESQQTLSRANIATALRSLAAQLDHDGPVTFDADDGSVSVQPPDHPTFGVEVERETEGDAAGTSIELEIEWLEPEASGEAVGETTESATATENRTEATAEVEAVESLGRFEVFQDRVGEWRWRLVHRNGNIIATGGEGYTSRQNALKGMRSVMRNAPGANVVSK